ncbi:MAG TPA: DUF4199 domain-containing protein [Panacibacter sp.]|nr:DUF4199 domain-containing protein [Panacibacter sp.]HNP45591.1 DUF4199 domain-containing protein [Panacibacter sp.]
MEQKVVTPVQKGLLISLVLIVFGLAVYFTGQTTNKSLNSIQYILLFGGIVWSCHYYAKQMNGNVTFGNVFAHGFKTSAFVAALTAVYSFVAVKFLFPDMMEMGINEARKQMQSQNNLSEEQIDQALEITRKFFVPIVIGSILLMFALIGAIASLVGAGIAKKNPKDPFAQPLT